MIDYSYLVQGERVKVFWTKSDSLGFEKRGVSMAVIDDEELPIFCFLVDWQVIYLTLDETEDINLKLKREEKKDDL